VTWLALPLLAVTAAMAVATPSQAAVGCSASYHLVRQWPPPADVSHGYHGEITVTNTGDEHTRGWQLAVTFPLGTRQIIWTSVQVVVDSLTSPTVANAPWNGVLSPGSSFTFIVVVSAPFIPQSTGPTSITCSAT
jgi:hypothetical protein